MSDLSDSLQRLEYEREKRHEELMAAEQERIRLEEERKWREEEAREASKRRERVENAKPRCKWCGKSFIPDTDTSILEYCSYRCAEEALDRGRLGYDSVEDYTEGEERKYGERIEEAFQHGKILEALILMGGLSQLNSSLNLVLIKLLNHKKLGGYNNELEFALANKNERLSAALDAEWPELKRIIEQEGIDIHGAAYTRLVERMQNGPQWGRPFIDELVKLLRNNTIGSAIAQKSADADNYVISRKDLDDLEFIGRRGRTSWDLLCALEVSRQKCQNELAAFWQFVCKGGNQKALWPCLPPYNAYGAALARSKANIPPEEKIVFVAYGNIDMGFQANLTVNLATLPCKALLAITNKGLHYWGGNGALKKFLSWRDFLSQQDLPFNERAALVVGPGIRMSHSTDVPSWMEYSSKLFHEYYASLLSFFKPLVISWRVLAEQHNAQEELLEQLEEVIDEHEVNQLQIVVGSDCKEKVEVFLKQNNEEITLSPAEKSVILELDDAEELGVGSSSLLLRRGCVDLLYTPEGYQKYIYRIAKASFFSKEGELIPVEAEPPVWETPCAERASSSARQSVLEPCGTDSENALRPGVDEPEPARRSVLHYDKWLNQKSELGQARKSLLNILQARSRQLSMQSRQSPVPVRSTVSTPEDMSNPSACYTVKLTAIGDRQFDVMKILGNFLAKELPEVVAMVQGELPVLVVEDADFATSQYVKKQLEAVGASVEYVAKDSQGHSDEEVVSKPQDGGQSCQTPVPVQSAVVSDNPSAFYTVKLTSIGNRQFDVLKALGNFLAKDLSELVSIVQGELPISVVDDADFATTQYVKAQLEEAGASVECVAKSSQEQKTAAGAIKLVAVEKTDNEVVSKPQDGSFVAEATPDLPAYPMASPPMLYAVYFNDLGTRKAEVVRVLAGLFDAEQSELMEFVQGELPALLVDDVDLGTAQKIKTQLEEVGAKVTYVAKLLPAAKPSNS